MIQIKIPHSVYIRVAAPSDFYVKEQLLVHLFFCAKGRHPAQMAPNHTAHAAQTRATQFRTRSTVTQERVTSTARQIVLSTYSSLR